MNTHEHLSIEILADYAEGLLGDADATSVAEHLASCADCQAEADLLVSVSSILAADDPGPMPAHFAARIDAALADLAAAEPVTPKRRETAAATQGAGEGATVIDLASRRRFAPAARVTSVAASLVLLIGGVALGMQALDTSDSENPGENVAGSEVEAVQTTQPAPADRASLYARVNVPKGNDRVKGKNGAIIDKNTGTVFIKNKVLFPDGTVVVHRKSGVAEVRTFSNGQIQVEQVRSPRTAPVSTPAETPETTPKAVERTPVPTPTPTPTPTPEATIATPPSSNPWVENSGEVYTPDNFATKIQALLRNSGDTTPGNQPGDGTTDQNRVAAGALRAQNAAVKARGPAPADVAAKVKRCANQLGLSDVLAGDAGTWRGQAATIVVTRLGAGQATGYVVYGDCTREAPATQADVQWEQRVDLPAKDEQPTESPTAAPGNGDGNGDTVNDTVTGRATNSVSSSVEQ